VRQILPECKHAVAVRKGGNRQHLISALCLQRGVVDEALDTAMLPIRRCFTTFIRLYCRLSVAGQLMQVLLH